MIDFEFKDYLFLFIRQVLCKYLFDCFKSNEPKTEKSRYDYLNELFEEGSKRLDKQLSLEKLLLEIREIK